MSDPMFWSLGHLPQVGVGGGSATSKQDQWASPDGDGYSTPLPGSRQIGGEIPCSRGTHDDTAGEPGKGGTCRLRRPLPEHSGRMGGLYREHGVRVAHRTRNDPARDREVTLPANQVPGRAATSKE